MTQQIRAAAAALVIEEQLFFLPIELVIVSKNVTPSESGITHSTSL